MLAPSLSSTRLAEAHRAEHTGRHNSHSARIHEIQRERLDPATPVSTLANRLLTVRRLASERLTDLGHAARLAGHRRRPIAAPHAAAGGIPR